MDLVVLQRLAEELDATLGGRRIERVYGLPPFHLALVVDSRNAPRLWFAAEPEEPHLYLRTGSHASLATPPGFAMAVRKFARGQCIAAVRLVGADRVVSLEWEGNGARLIFELLPRRPTALLIGPDEMVIAVWNPRRGRPGVGERYAAPTRNARPSVDALAPEDWELIAAAGDDRRLVRELVRQIDGCGRLIAAEAVCRWREGGTLAAAVRAELERAATEATHAVIATRTPVPGALNPSGDKTAILAPYPLRSCAADRQQPFDSLLDAAAVYYPQRAARRLVDRTRSELRDRLGAQRRRLQRAVDRIVNDAPETDAAERLRRHADLLLAHPEVRVVDGQALVPDDYSDGSQITLQLDPALDRVANAQRLYRRAGRVERKLRHDARRSRQLRSSLRELDELDRRCGVLMELAERRVLLDKAQALGLKIRDVRARDAEAPLLEPEMPSQVEHDTSASSGNASSLPTGIARFVCANGEEILVGRNARANDRLTHQLADRDDWWLHAVGPGSHVILRNPRHLSEPPAEALQAAACTAAWFSKARQATKVDVHWTQARHVRRPRRAAPGMVLLSRHQTVMVEPRDPNQAFPSAEPNSGS